MSARSGPSLDLQFNYSFWHLTHSLHWLCGKFGKDWRSWYEKKIRKSERRGKSVQERKQSSLRRKREESRRKEGNNILLECSCLFLLSPSFHSKHHLWSPYPNHLIFLHSAMTSLDKLLCYHHGTSDKPFGLVTDVWNTPPHTHTKETITWRKGSFSSCLELWKTSILLIQEKSTSVLFLSLPPSHSSFQFLRHWKE